VSCPGFSGESADDDDRVGDAGVDLGVDGEFLEPVVVSGIGAFHDSSGAGLERSAFVTVDPVVLTGSLFCWSRSRHPDER